MSAPAPRPPTPQQGRAADPARSVWVAANAGTGKTRVLTDRILRLMLAGAAPEAVLAITFTNAAASEMRHRVETTLARWATAGAASLAHELELLTGTAPTAATLARARDLLAAVLDLPAGLPITTIHAFCGGLLRRFPLEAGIAPQFETLDERTSRELIAQARAAVLETGADPASPHAAALARLAVLMAEQSLTAALASLVHERMRLLAARARHDGAADLFRAIRTLLQVEHGRTREEVLARACAIGDQDRRALRAAAERLSHGSDADRMRARTVAAWLDLDPAARVGRLDGYLAAFLTQKGTERDALCTKAIRERHPDVERALRAECGRLMRVSQELTGLRTAERTEALLTVGFAVIDRYEGLKRERGALDFDDLIARAGDLLASPDRVEWVLYKLDQRIEHVLVDEAQDTSPAQWRVIERLVDEFFAGAGAHGPRTVFVVGDEKQSIYSFQGADLETFKAVRRHLERRAADAGMALDNVTLDRSFRSSGAVLAAVDAVFHDPEAHKGVAEAPPRHLSERPGDPGLVELWPLAAPLDEDDAPEEPWPLPDGRRPRDEPERRLAAALAARIAAWCREAAPLPSTKAPPTPGDVVVLLQRRGSLQDLLVQALKRERVPVAGADRLDLTAHLAVKDLMALGRLVLLPEDDLNLACLLKSPLMGLDPGEPARFGLDDDELLELAHGRGAQPLVERLRVQARAQGGRLAQAEARLRAWAARADYEPPFEFFARVTGADGGRARLLVRLGRDAAEPIEAFLAQALAYEEGHPASLQGFLHWLGLGEEDLKRETPSAGGAVRVLTVHGAKGLEAPIVVLADAGPRHDPGQRPCLVWRGVDGDPPLPFWRGRGGERDPLTEDLVAEAAARQRDESRRLLYVALTRAKDRLYVAGRLPRRGGEVTDEPAVEKASWHQLVRGGLERAAGSEPLDLDLGHGIAGPGLRLARGVAAVAGEAPRAAEPPASLPAWARTPPAAEPPRRRPVRASALDQEHPPLPAPLTGAEAQALRKGTLVHRLLELLPRLPEPERPAAMRRYLDARAADLAAADRTAIEAAVAGVLAHPALAPVFAADALAEQPIAGVLDGVAISGQIDRLAVGATAILVVDYKTNRRPPDHAEAAPVAYLRQMAAYRRLLGALYPDKVVQAALVWTETGTVMGLPPELLDRQGLQPPERDPTSLVSSA